MSDYLAKKHNKGGMEGGSGVAPGQAAMKAPQFGVKNTKFQANNNTKAKTVKGSVPQGKAHAKVMGAPTDMKKGRYL